MAKLISYFLLAGCFMMSCSTYKKTHTAHTVNRAQEMQIHWPAAYAPEKAIFFVHNQVEILADPMLVWQILIQAEAWPEIYSGASEVLLQDTASHNLEAHSVFSWKTMGLNLTSSVREFVPHSRLSWESKKKSIQAYHAWLLIPTEEGCLLITDEAQQGWLTFFEKVFQPKKLHRLHEIWLQAIKQKAENLSKQNTKKQ